MSPTKPRSRRGSPPSGPISAMSTCSSITPVRAGGPSGEMSRSGPPGVLKSKPGRSRRNGEGACVQGFLLRFDDPVRENGGRDGKDRQHLGLAGVRADITGASAGVQPRSRAAAAQTTTLWPGDPKSPYVRRIKAGAPP
jgi:hypothetical protein